MSEKKQALRIFVPFPVWWLIWIAFYYYFEFHIFKIIERKILNVKIEWITHSTHDTGERFFFQAAIKCFWKKMHGDEISCVGRALHWSWLQCNWEVPAFHAFLHNWLWRDDRSPIPFNPHISHSDLDHKIFRSILGSAFHCFETAKGEAS